MNAIAQQMSSTSNLYLQEVSKEKIHKYVVRNGFQVQNLSTYLEFDNDNDVNLLFASFFCKYFFA